MLRCCYISSHCAARLIVKSPRHGTREGGAFLLCARKILFSSITRVSHLAGARLYTPRFIAIAVGMARITVSFFHDDLYVSRHSRTRLGFPTV